LAITGPIPCSGQRIGSRQSIRVAPRLASRAVQWRAFNSGGAPCSSPDRTSTPPNTWIIRMAWDSGAAGASRLALLRWASIPGPGRSLKRRVGQRKCAGHAISCDSPASLRRGDVGIEPSRKPLEVLFGRGPARPRQRRGGGEGHQQAPPHGLHDERCLPARLRCTASQRHHPCRPTRHHTPRINGHTGERAGGKRRQHEHRRDGY